MDIILASKSLARKKSLDILGLTYRIEPAEIDEKSIRHENPIELVKLLSIAKAKKLGESNKDSIIIAGDLVNYFEGKIIEKPVGLNDAKRMLLSYSGKWISIIGSVVVYNSKENRIHSAVEEYLVKFRELSQSEVDDYVARNQVLNFAGAFDGDGAYRFAEESKSNYPFLPQMSWPMNKLIEFLRTEGIKV